MQNNEIIKVDNLYCVYNENEASQLVALADINYTFYQNKIYCIIGNSGSGKSTLVTHFNGLIKSKYGQVETTVLKLGLPYNLNDINIYPLKSDDPDYDYFVFNIQKISTRHASIIIESIYKTKTINLKRVKQINTPYAVFKTKFDKTYIIEIINKLTLDEINQKIKKPVNLYKPSISELWKNRKIKKFRQLRKEIGMVFQFPEYQLFKDTIEKDIMFGPIALGIKPDVAKIKAKEYLNKLGMGDEYLNRNPFGLSGGQKRRVAIAGILAIETPILIFDEPTAGLDPVGEQEMMHIILDAKKNNRSVFVITHTMDHVLEIADEVLVMDNGEIIKHGTPYEIFLDQELLTQTSINTPKVIKFINDLVKQNPKFQILYEKAPRTVDELSYHLNQLLKG